MKNVLIPIFCHLFEKFGAHGNIFFEFFAHGIFAQKINLCWKVPVLNKKHLILLHTIGSRGVSSCRKMLAFSTFFSGLHAKQPYLHNWPIFLFWMKLNILHFVSFVFVHELIQIGKKLDFLMGLFGAKIHKRISERIKTYFLYCLLLAFAVELHTGLVATFLSSENLRLSLWLHLA